jgi:hypothetical protein
VHVDIARSTQALPVHQRPAPRLTTDDGSDEEPVARRRVTRSLARQLSRTRADPGEAEARANTPEVLRSNGDDESLGLVTIVRVELINQAK